MSDLQFLTVVTFGRSGSTALQSALNSHDHVLIRGENYGALTGLWQYGQSLMDSRDRHHSGKPDHPWFGTAKLDPNAALSELNRHVISHVLRPKPGTIWSGFKEVRYESAYFRHNTQLVAYLLYLQDLLPNLRFLFNTRHPSHARSSGWWRESPDAETTLTKTVTNLMRSAAILTDLLGHERVQIIDYDDWNNDPDVLEKALKNLNFPVETESIKRALNSRLTHGKVIRQ